METKLTLRAVVLLSLLLLITWMVVESCRSVSMYANMIEAQKRNIDRFDILRVGQIVSENSSNENEKKENSYDGEGTENLAYYSVEPASSIVSLNMSIEENEREGETEQLVHSSVEDSGSNDSLTLEELLSEEESEGKFTPMSKDGPMYQILRFGFSVNEKLLKNERNFSKEEQGGSGIHIITTFFKGDYSDTRFREIVATLVSNLRNPYVTTVHVLWEGDDLVNPGYYVPDEALMEKLFLTHLEKQPTYKQLFQYANDNFKRGSIAIVTNADIYFDRSLSCLSPVRPEHENWNSVKRLVYALSRKPNRYCPNKRDHPFKYGVMDLCKTYSLSHDTFIFSPPLSQRLINRFYKPQNEMSSENVIIYLMKKAGYHVRNPCELIHAKHLHCSMERHYKKVFYDSERHSSAKPTTRIVCGEPLY